MKYILILLSFWAVTMQSQPLQSATIKGYSPALKDNTLAECIIDRTRVASDTVKSGHFSMTVPVEKLTEGMLFLKGEGCPRYLKKFYLAPDVEVNMTGTDCIYPTWKVESSLPEQITSNRIFERINNALTEYIQLSFDNAPYEKQDSVYDIIIKQTIDILPTLPIDLAVLDELEGVALYATDADEFPYMDQLKTIEKSIAIRAPKIYEDKLTYIHSLLYPSHILQIGEEAIDTDFFDMEGGIHHLAELYGRYLLLDFWSLGCGPCVKAEPEMRYVRGLMNDKMEIIGINMDKLSSWQENDWSKQLVWKNWSDGKMGKNGINIAYCDKATVPYYVLISPNNRIVWKYEGYIPGMFLGMYESINGPKQDNSINLSLAIRHVETNPIGTTISFRYYGSNKSNFLISSNSYIIANGRKYMLKTADGVTPDRDNYPSQSVCENKDYNLNSLFYTDFKLTFDPFEEIPASFEFRSGDGDGNYVIQNISIQ